MKCVELIKEIREDLIYHNIPSTGPKVRAHKSKHNTWREENRDAYKPSFQSFLFLLELNKCRACMSLTPCHLSSSSHPQCLRCPSLLSLLKDTSKLHLNTTPPSLTCDHYTTTLHKNLNQATSSQAAIGGSSQPLQHPSS
jgi:hypothetical protein